MSIASSLSARNAGLSQFVGISGNDLEVLSEFVRRVGIDECYSVLQFETGLREIASIESANNSTTPERISEFFIKGREQVLIGRFRQIGEINFNPCLFG